MGAAAPTPGLQLRNSTSSGTKGATDWRFIVSLQRIATCGINYAAIMSCFVAESFGLTFYESVGINYIIFRDACSAELIRWSPGTKPITEPEPLIRNEPEPKPTSLDALGPLEF